MRVGQSAESASGFWTGVYFGATARFCAGKSGEIEVSEPDRKILQSLSRRVRQLANDPREQEKRELWYVHNDLRERYPVVLCDPENGWNEIIPEQALQSRGSLSRRWEWILRRQIFWAERLRDDRPIEAIFEVGRTYTDSEWGIEVTYHGGENGTAYAWEPALRDSGEIGRIKEPVITVDNETTDRTVALAMSVFGQELEVRLAGLNPNSPHITRDVVKLVGLQDMMEMMYDAPETIHAIMKSLVAGYASKYDFLERNSLLSLNNDGSYVGSGGIGYTRDLPGKRAQSGVRILTQDLWLHTESQESIGISPEMFKEFIFPYQTGFHARFGLNCYGCCEPMEGRWNTVRQIPNLRRVSVSAWADEEKMAANLGSQYIYSRKPSPVDLAAHELNEDSARRSIRRTLEVTNGGCIVEFVMKDNHTIGGNPENVVRWVDIARDEIAHAYGKT